MILFVTSAFVLSLASVAIGTGPSMSIYNKDNRQDATFSITTAKSISSLEHITELGRDARQFCYTGVYVILKYNCINTIIKAN